MICTSPIQCNTKECITIVVLQIEHQIHPKFISHAVYLLT